MKIEKRAGLYVARIGEWMVVATTFAESLNTGLELFFTGCFSKPQVAILKGGKLYA